MRIRRFLLKKLIPEFVWPRQVEIDGVEFAVANTPYSFSVKRLLSKHSKNYEAAERGFLRELKPTDHVIEYGSSIGILTALICERAYAGRVISVEASKDLLEYSKTWLSRYKNLELVYAAAFPLFDPIATKISFDDSSGSLGGLVDFDFNGNEVNGKEVKDNEASNSKSSCASNKKDSPLNSFFIANALERGGFIPTVLIMDIEGTERCLLDHPANFPSSLDRLIIELHPYLYGDAVTQSLITEICAQGFTLKERRHDVYFFERLA